MQYLQRVSRIRISYLAREYWFELLIGALAIAAIIELILVAGRAELEHVVRRTRSGGPDAAALHAPAVSLRRSGCLLDPRGGALLCRRRADPVDREPVPRRVGVRRPAREPARRQAGVDRLGDRPRRHYGGCLQHPRPHDRRAHPDSRRLRNRLGRRLRSARASGAGRSGGGARGPGRARAGGGCPRRRGRGARADRARAPRHRRPRGQRHGAPDRRGPAQAPPSAGRGQGCAQRRRAGRPLGACGDAPAARRNAPATARSSN